MPEEDNRQEGHSEKELTSFSLYKEIVDRAHEEVIWVRSAYKFTGSLVAVLIAIGLFFSYRSTREFKSELKEDGQAIQRKLEGDISALETRLTQSLETRVNVLERKVSERVEQQFGKDEIRLLVEATAQKRIDAIADDLIKHQIADRIDPFEKEFKATLDSLREKLGQIEENFTKQIKETESKRSMLDSTVVEARELLKALKTQGDFMMVVIAADHDDRNAFNRLESWSTDPSFAFQSMATQAKMIIKSQYVDIAIQKRPFVMPHWQPGLDLSTLKVENLVQVANSVESFQLPGMVELAWKEQKIAKSVRAAFLVEVMRGTGNSLQAANHAGSLLAKEADLKLGDPFNFQPIIAWWEENKTRLDEITVEK